MQRGESWLSPYPETVRLSPQFGRLSSQHCLRLVSTPQMPHAIDSPRGSGDRHIKKWPHLPQPGGPGRCPARSSCEQSRHPRRINDMFASTTDRKVSTVVVLVAAACYASSYLWLVQRKPVYYGNRLVQVPLARLEFSAIENGKLENETLPIGDPISAPADTYRVDYRFNSDWIRIIFRPAHWIDRALRPNYWPTPDWRRSSC